MEMYYDGELVMPSSYAIGLVFCPYFAPLKFAGKAVAKALVRTYLPKLAGVFRKIVTSAIGIGINVSTGTLGNILFSNAWCLTSVGGMVSLVADIVSDGSCNKRISF